MAGVRDFRELRAWQLANQLRVQAHVLVQRPGVAQHRKYCEQLTDAASSAARNIAEGFGRFRHREFAQLVRVAKGSEHEVLDLLLEAKQRGFTSEHEFTKHESLARQAIAAATGLIRYLENSPEK
jgi:four helix bundle protein